MAVSMMAFTILNMTNTNERVFGPRMCILNIRQGRNSVFIQIQHTIYEWSFFLSDLDGMYIDSIDEGYLALSFERPMTQVILNNEDPTELINFVGIIHESIRSAGLIVHLNEDFDPHIRQFICTEHYVRDMSNVNHLSTLILENCVLPTLTSRLGDLPISHLSLNGSTLGTSRYEREIFWNWMSKDNICETLKVLEMNSVNLQVLPFEIMFLKKLQTLSVANNKLKLIPHIIGELKELENFFVNNNLLSCVPERLQERTFKNMNFFDNEFLHDNSYISIVVRYEANVLTMNKRKAGKPICPKLSHLSIFSLINNDIKLNRQNIPRSLWSSFQTVSRCSYCQRIVMPENCIENFTPGFARTQNIIRNVFILWQSFVCSYRCRSYPKIPGNVFP